MGSQARVQAYLDRVIQWLYNNNLILADKTQATLFTPDPAEFNHTLNLKIDGKTLDA